jgi:hypothetical protein
LKINTITDSFSGDNKRLEEIQRWLEVHTSTSLKTFKVPPIKPSFYEVLISSSPGSLCSWQGILLDAAYIRSSSLLEPFKVLIKETKSEKLLDQFIKACVIYDAGPKINHQVARKPLAFDRDINYLGQLQFKDEPAGKVRVFAMVDS